MINHLISVVWEFLVQPKILFHTLSLNSDGKDNIVITAPPVHSFSYYGSLSVISHWSFAQYRRRVCLLRSQQLVHIRRCSLVRRINIKS